MNSIKGKNSVIHFEAVFLSILAIILTLIIELNIINEWLIKLNDDVKLTFDDNFFVLKNAIGLIILSLMTYSYAKWNINQGYRDKKRKLKHFIQMMNLANGLALKI